MEMGGCHFKWDQLLGVEGLGLRCFEGLKLYLSF